MTAKQELRDFVEGLGETEALMWLQALRTGDSVLLNALLAPIDDEPETEEERSAVARAHVAYREGRVSPSSKVRRDLMG